MKHQVLAGAAVLALIAGGAASANTKSSGAFAPPSQPVAYSKLDSYLKASPHKKATGDWGLDSTSAATAPIGGAANTSATAPQTSQTPDQSQPQAGMMPQSGAAPSSAPDNSAGTDTSAGPAAAPQAAQPPATPSETAPPAQSPPDQNAPATGTTAPAGGMSQSPDSTPSTQPPGQ